VGYPTDSGLLAKGVAALGRMVMVLKVTGLARRTPFRDRGRSVCRPAHNVAVVAQTEKAHSQCCVVTKCGNCGRSSKVSQRAEGTR
jgi:hypothetical protein